MSSNIELLKYICSNDILITKVNEELKDFETDIKSVTNYIINFAKYHYDSNVPIIFEPWIYIAGYSSTKDIYWDNVTNSLNEEFVCVSYITHGFINNYRRNFLGYICNIYLSKRILYKTCKICVVGNSLFSKEIRNKINKYDIVVRCNRADNFIPDEDKIDYLVYRTVIFDQRNKWKNKLKNAVVKSKVIVEIDGSLNSPSSKLKVDLDYSKQNYYPYLMKYTPIYYNYKLKKTHTKKPSTGFCAITMLLSLYPGLKIDLYGFNFTGTFHHNWEYEHKFCIRHEDVNIIKT